MSESLRQLPNNNKAGRRGHIKTNNNKRRTTRTDITNPTGQEQQYLLIDRVVVSGDQHIDLLHRTVQDACQFAYGIKMVEVWVWDASRSKLFRPEGGWWIDPYWHKLHGKENEENGTTTSRTFCQLVDASRRDYIAPPMLSPGVGIPGVLWSDLRFKDRKHKRKESGPGGSGGVLDANFLLQVLGNLSFNENRLDQAAPMASKRIAWRDVKALADDPDQPRNHRLQVIASTDVRWTGGVPFQIKGDEGVVVYYARDKVDFEKLNDNTNTDYLIQAADFIGSAWALRLPRMAAQNRRQEENAHNFRRVRRALVSLLRANVSLDELCASGTSGGNKKDSTRLRTRLSDFFHPAPGMGRCHLALWIRLKKKVQQSLTKMRGGGTTAPPTASWNQSTLTAVGTLLSLLSICAVNEIFSNTFRADYGFPMGPMAALLALQFGLSAAPAAQPRTIIVGHILSIVTALIIGEIPSVPLWVKQSLACGLAVGLMAKLSVVNPPAASAFMFANGTWGIINMMTALMGCLMAITFSVLINNLSDKRQYPSFWGIPEIHPYCQVKTRPTYPIQHILPSVEFISGRMQTMSRMRKVESQAPGSPKDNINASASTSTRHVTNSGDVELGTSRPPKVVLKQEAEDGRL
jgi:HPP family